MKKLLVRTLVIFGVIFMSSCGKDSYFNCFISLKNSTEHNIYVEKTLSDNSVELTCISAEDASRILIGETDRHLDEDLPPKPFITEKLRKIRIYKEIDGSIQELPKHYYDNPDDYTISTDYFMGISEIYYCIEITEKMFKK